jgi:hypothetical protein
MNFLAPPRPGNPANVGSHSPQQKEHPLKAIMDEIHAIMRHLDAQQHKQEAAFEEMQGMFNMKVASLEDFFKLVSHEKSELLRKFNQVSDEEEFWSKLADLDLMCDRTQSQIDEIKSMIYFSPFKGYTYRFAAPGVYFAVGDFWLAELDAKVNFEMVPGRGAVWEGHGVPPGLALKASPVTVSLHIEDLGLRGDKIPSQLRHIKEIDLTAELDLYVPLAFVPPPRKFEEEEMNPSQASAGKPNSQHPQSHHLPHQTSSNKFSGKSKPSINKLVTYQWKVLDTFRFEVLKIECKTVGTGIPVPNSLLKYLLNALVPTQLKKAIVRAIPAELGVLLSLHGDHHINFDGDIKMSSLPLDCLNAPLDQAVDVSNKPNTSSGASSSPPNALLGIRNVLQESGTGAHSPPYQATRAARAIGLTPAQARAFVLAQTAVPGNKGPLLRTAADLIRFAAQYNPKSRLKRLQRKSASQLGATTDISFGTSSSAPEGSDELPDPLWVRLCNCFQRLVEEHAQLQLAEMYEQAAAATSKQQQRQITMAAQARTKSAFYQTGIIFLSADALYSKPIRLSVSIRDLLIRFHAETLIGLGKSIITRVIRSKQAKATSGKSKKQVSQSASNRNNSTKGLKPGTNVADGEAGSHQASSSLYSQLQRVREVSTEAIYHVSLIHSFTTRATASINGSLQGGERGRVSAIVRQVQLELAAGVCLPLGLRSGFFPPGTLVTSINSTSDLIDANDSTFTEGKAKERLCSEGAFSIQLCWPKTLLSKYNDSSSTAAKVAASESMKNFAAATAAKRLGVDDESSSEIARSISGSISSDKISALNSLSASQLEKIDHFPQLLHPDWISKVTASEVDVMATIRLHRAWVGLRVDEASLLNMVARRAELQASGVGIYGSSKGMPALHALEVNVRPGYLGSSYVQPGLSGIDISNATTPGASSIPYVISMEMPPWIRSVVEIIALEVFGDMDVLSTQLSFILDQFVRNTNIPKPTINTPTVNVDAPGRRPSDVNPIVESAEAEETVDSETISQLKSSTISEVSLVSNTVSVVTPGSDVDAAAQYNPFSDSFVPMSEEVQERKHSSVSAVDTPVVPEDSPVVKPSVKPLLSYLLQPKIDDSALALRKAKAAEAREIASFQLASRVNRYLKSEDLHLSLNLFASIVSVPAPPLAGLSDDLTMLVEEAKDGSDANLQTLSSMLHPVLLDISGLDIGTSKDAAHLKSMGVRSNALRSTTHLRKVLSFTLSSKHTLQPSIIPPPGSGLVGESDNDGVSEENIVSNKSENLPKRASTKLITVPALKLDLQVSFLQLLEDIEAIREAWEHMSRFE